MAKLPKPQQWITEVEAENIVAATTGADFLASNDALRDALVEGLIQSRKCDAEGRVIIKLAPEYWSNEKKVAADRDDWSKKNQIHRSDLMKWLAPAAPEKASPSRGRPTKWDWEAFWIEAVRLANTPDGLPDVQAEFEAHMATWFEDTAGGSPSESQIREKAGRLYPTKA